MHHWELEKLRFPLVYNMSNFSQFIFYAEKFMIYPLFSPHSIIFQRPESVQKFFERVNGEDILSPEFQVGKSQSLWRRWHSSLSYTYSALQVMYNI